MTRLATSLKKPYLARLIQTLTRLGIVESIGIRVVGSITLGRELTARRMGGLLLLTLPEAGLIGTLIAMEIQ